MSDVVCASAATKACSSKSVVPTAETKAEKSWKDDFWLLCLAKGLEDQSTELQLPVWVVQVQNNSKVMVVALRLMFVLTFASVAASGSVFTADKMYGVYFKNKVWWDPSELSWSMMLHAIEGYSGFSAAGGC